jgi:hypothetical protein
LIDEISGGGNLLLSLTGDELWILYIKQLLDNYKEKLTECME